MRKLLPLLLSLLFLAGCAQQPAETTPGAAYFFQDDTGAAITLH